MFLRFIRKSLRLKLILATVLVEVVMLSILLGNNWRIINATIEEQSSIRTESITPLLDSALSISLFERDSATLHELLERLIDSNNSQFSYIKVFDKQHSLYAEHISQNSDFNSAQNKHKTLTISSPLTLAGETIGRLEYGLNIGSLYASKDRLIKQSAYIAIIEILLTVILLGITSYFLTRHISVLLKGAENISKGHYDINIAINTPDEIGLLANGFNSMARAVQDRVKQLSQSSTALSIKTAEFESMFNSILDGVIFVDKQRRCISVNPAMTALFGYSMDEFIDKKLNFLYKNQDEYENLRRLRYSDKTDQKDHSLEICFKRKDGSKFIGELRASKVRDKNNNTIGFISILRDIDDRKRNEFKLMEAKEKALVTLESIGDAVITTDEQGLVQYLNPVAEELTAWNTCDAKGKALPEVFNIFNEATNEPVENPVIRVLKDNVIIGLANHTVLVNKQGKKHAIEDSAAPIRDKQGNILGVILVFHDVSHARNMAEQLSWQASHDSLTGLINRLEFESRLETTLENSNDIKSHALLYMDLDQFKIINDTCGHVAGDELLKQLSALFLTHIRDNDTLARLGGDEFGILLINCPADRAYLVAENIIRELEQFRFSWQEKVFTAGVSIGLVPFHNDNKETISTLMSTADVACYAAKDAGRNRIHLYTQGDDELEQRHGEMAWVTQIQYALEHERFELYCQPIVSTSLNESDTHHYEILIRMRDKEGNLIGPMSFLPPAERYNLMPEIDRWVISNVIKQIEKHPLDQSSMIAINLSGNSLSDDKFLNFVIDQLSNKNINASQFCFEITETAAISNLSHVTAFIAKLNTFGCQFSLDDFGSGLSSFTYLKNLNVDYLKIDGAFVKDMKNDLIDRSMVEAINKIGHVMSMKTIAEFVEDKETYDMLREIGIDYAQGYYFSKPFPFKNLKSNLV